MGKGDKRRACQVSTKEYARNYDRIFKGVEPEIPTATQVECTAIVKYVPPDLTKMDHPTACKYLVEGMRVKLLRRAEEDEKGWSNSWEKRMGFCVGKIYTVESINVKTGVSLRGISYRYPAFCLQIIEQGDNIGGS